MAISQERKRNSPASRRRKPIAPKDDRTKFDKWLERMRDDRSPVVFNFAIPPISSMTDLMETQCQVIDVDRYMILLKFAALDEVFWVAKSIITSAAQDTDL